MMALKLVSLGRGASGVRWELVALLEAMLANGVAAGRPGRRARSAPPATSRRSRTWRPSCSARARRCTPAGGCRRREALAAAGLAPIDARGQGRPGADQRHAVLHRLGARRPVRRLARGAERAARLGDVDRRDHGLDRAASAPRSTRCAAIAGRSRRRAAMRALHGGLGDPREPPRGRQPRAGPLLHPLPAAGDRRRDGPAAPGRRDAGDRGQRRHRQPAGPRRRQIVSGGNFHAEPVAFAADIIALAVAEIGAIAQRRSR